MQTMDQYGIRYRTGICIPYRIKMADIWVRNADAKNGYWDRQESLCVISTISTVWKISTAVLISTVGETHFQAWKLRSVEHAYLLGFI